MANALMLYQRPIVRWCFGRLASAMQSGRRWTLAGVRLWYTGSLYVSRLPKGGAHAGRPVWPTRR
jgi:hypothetical protein